MMYSSRYLFIDSELRIFLQDRMDDVTGEVKTQDTNYILNVDPQKYSDYLVGKFTLEIPFILEENIYVGQEETAIDVSKDPNRFITDRTRPIHLTGTRITYYVPFTGDSILFRYRPSTFTTNPPEGVIVGQELLLSFEGVDLKSEDVSKNFSKRLNDIKKWLGFVTKDVTDYNRKLVQDIELKIKTRREKLLADSDLVTSLGFPLREVPEAPKTYTVPSKRIKIVPKPSASTEPFKPEPTISMDDYEHILSVVQNMTLVMERSPHVFKNMGEEDIRQHFLVQLNGQYEGDATGETFNYEGKTDILIRKNEKNLFIAECKFWSGEVGLKETIDQILRYLCWRDTKTAIFLFNRNKNFTNVLLKIPDVVKEHPNFEKEIGYESETGFRFIFHHNDDPNRKLYLTLLAFDIPK